MKKIEQSFLEKYRPKKEEDVVGNSIIKERIFSQLKEGRLNNMILSGGSGLGKTTIAEIVAKELLKENYFTDCIIFNCSDKTGVDNIRSNIIEIETLKPIGFLRIFIMEESEWLSKSAQNALKKALEAPYDKSNRFIFLTNDITKFIPAIKDRCRIYTFMPIQPEEMLPRLRHITDKEEILIDDGLLLRLAHMSNGSMRYPIIQLEEFKTLNRRIVEKDLKLEKNLESVKVIFSLLKERKIPYAKSKILEMYQDGSNFNDVLRYLHDFTIMSLGNDLNFNVKAQTLIAIAKAERNVNEGCNEFIQISFLLSKIAVLLQEIEK